MLNSSFGRYTALAAFAAIAFATPAPAKGNGAAAAAATARIGNEEGGADGGRFMADGFFSVDRGSWTNDDAGRLRVCTTMKGDDIVFKACMGSSERLLPDEYLSRIVNSKSKFIYAGMSRGPYNSVTIYYRAVDKAMLDEGF